MNAALASGRWETEEVPCLCDSTSFAEIATSDRYGLAQQTVICRQCGLVQSNPRLTPTALSRFYGSDEYRRVYDGPDYLRRYEEHFHDGRGELVFAFVTGHRPRERIGSVLEFGCGGGWNLAPFHAAGIPVRGYDYSPELVAMGRGRGLDLRQGDLDAIEGRFDVIVLYNVLEHLTDPVAALRRLRDHLAPAGELFVEVPDIESFAIGQLQNAHTYYFTEATLRHYAARAGLATTAFEHDRPTGHMRGAFAAVPPVEPPTLAGHYERMAQMLTAYNRTWRLRAPLRAAGRALDVFGLKDPLKRLLRRRPGAS